FLQYHPAIQHLHSFPTRRSSDLIVREYADKKTSQPGSPPGDIESGSWPRPLASRHKVLDCHGTANRSEGGADKPKHGGQIASPRSEEHTSELQSRFDLVCRLLLE